jgi:hypothetical protein
MAVSRGTSHSATGSAAARLLEATFANVNLGDFAGGIVIAVVGGSVGAYGTLHATRESVKASADATFALARREREEATVLEALATIEDALDEVEINLGLLPQAHVGHAWLPLPVSEMGKAVELLGRPPRSADQYDWHRAVRSAHVQVVRYNALADWSNHSRMAVGTMDEELKRITDGALLLLQEARDALTSAAQWRRAR